MESELNRHQRRVKDWKERHKDSIDRKRRINEEEVKRKKAWILKQVNKKTK